MWAFVPTASHTDLLTHLDRHIVAVVVDKDLSVEAGVRQIRQDLGDILSKPPDPGTKSLDPHRPGVSREFSVVCGSCVNL